jgi:hypothetical protein
MGARGREAAPGPRQGVRPHRPVTIWLPDGPPVRAPEVDREWPIEEPRPRQPEPRPADRGPLAAALVILTVLAACLLSGLGPLVAAAAAILAGTVALLVVDRMTKQRGPAGALRRARDALLFGEDARGVLGRLRGVEASGRGPYVAVLGTAKSTKR